MRAHHVWTAIAALTVASAAQPQESATAAPAPAESAPREEARPPFGRILNGHVFMPSAAVPNALVTTSFASYLVAGFGSTTGSFQVGSQNFSGTYDFAGAGSVLGYEHAFGPYFSARLSINEIIYSGIDGKSATAVGTKVQFGGLLGVTASLPVGDSLRVALLLDAGSVPSLGLTVGTGIQNIVNSCGQPSGCDVDTSQLFGTTQVQTVQPAVAATWAPMRALGITGNVAYAHLSQKQHDTTFDADTVSLGVSTDYDFGAVSSVPLGLMLQFDWTAPVSGSGVQHVTDLGGGIFYTGREHLAVGLQLIARRFAVEQNLNVSWQTYITTIGLRYYW